MHIASTLHGTALGPLHQARPEEPEQIRRTDAAVSPPPEAGATRLIEKAAETMLAPPRSSELSAEEIEHITDVVHGLLPASSTVDPNREIADAAARLVMQKLDQDGDGAVSATEVTLPGPHLARADANGDGMITERELSDAIYAGFSALDGPAASDGPQRIAERLLEGERGMIGRANNNDYAGASTTFDPTDATQAPLTTTSIVTADSSAGAENPLQDLSDAARNIITELEKLGFTHQPPINLHDLLARFNLDLTSARFMLQSIASRYPQGLGLDFLG